jgi:hypothetical protein
MKIIIVLALLGIIGAMFMAGRAMLSDGRNGQPKTNRMVKALALRVALSIGLFVFIWFSYHMGWIHPNNVPLGQ